MQRRTVDLQRGVEAIPEGAGAEGLGVRRHSVMATIVAGRRALAAVIGEHRGMQPAKLLRAGAPLRATLQCSRGARLAREAWS